MRDLSKFSASASPPPPGGTGLFQPDPPALGQYSAVASLPDHFGRLGNTRHRRAGRPRGLPCQLGECAISRRILQLGMFLLLSRGAFTACRDCALPGLGGPAENRFTAFDTLCRTAACREAGVPQVSVNLSNLTLFVKVTDLAFGGGFTIDRSFNQGSGAGLPACGLAGQEACPAFGPGWSFSLGDSIVTDT